MDSLTRKSNLFHTYWDRKLKQKSIRALQGKKKDHGHLMLKGKGLAFPVSSVPASYLIRVE